MKTKNSIMLARDKRGRILPSMNRQNLAKLLGVSSDCSNTYILRLAEKTMKYDPELRYNLREMCLLEENAPSGLIKREMKKMIAA
jgi:hypothetical protein